MSETAKYAVWEWHGFRAEYRDASRFNLLPKDAKRVAKAASVFEAKQLARHYLSVADDGSNVAVVRESDGSVRYTR